MATIRAGYLAVALKLQEAADLSANDVRTRLADALNDQFRGTGKWAYLVDYFGDGESGDVIYSCDQDTMKASYEVSGGEGAAAKCVIDFEGAVDVVPRTVYEPEADEADHYAAMEEALRTEAIYTDLPIYERFISKKERDAADASDFAGKGKSFPILKPEDVAAAAHAMGRAGSGNVGPSAIKARIISIAKRKGWTKYLPKAWQGDDGEKVTEAGARNSARDLCSIQAIHDHAASLGATCGVKESSTSHQTGLTLVESAATVEVIHLQESKADYEIKLIAPGKGSSAFYPAEVLKRDGPNVFKAGTHVYLNHPTAAEEAQRPEGDVANLAGVLTTSAVYHESHPKGPGLFARMKVFADHATMVEEKAAHVGMSIRASGVAEAGKTKEGVPVLKELTGAESVDVVTRAGAGGMILTEAARNAVESTTGGATDMDAAEVTKIVEAAVKAALAPVQAQQAPLLERALRGDAREEATRILSGISLHEAAKTLVVENVLQNIPVKDGALDTAKLKESVDAEAKRIGAAFAAAGTGARVVGMGAAPVQIDAKEADRRAAAAKEEAEDAIKVFESLGMPRNAAEFAANGRAA